MTSLMLTGILLLIFSPFTEAASVHPHLIVRYNGASILLIHGFDNDVYGGSSGFDCYLNNDADGMGTLYDYLRVQHFVGGANRTWNGRVYTISYYKGDTCSPNLHDVETTHCKNYYPQDVAGAPEGASSDGTNNESIYHLSCLLAWYIYDNFGVHPGWNIEIVAHSMGGLLIRNAIYQVAKKKATWAFPPTLGGISDVVTLSTPHGGVPPLAPAFVNCNAGGRTSCTQVQEMVAGSDFMNEMSNSANASDAQATGGTDWTLIGSDCDVDVSESSALWMNGGRKSVFVAEQHSNGSYSPCYSHDDTNSGITQDTHDLNDGIIYYCDGCPRPPSTPIEAPGHWSWSRLASAPRSLLHVMHALWFDTW